MNRRDFLAASAAVAAGATLKAAPPKGKAEHCIFVWLGGGMGQVDTFDPKPVGDPRQGAKKPGSLYKSIDTAVKGVQLTEHLPRLAPHMDRVTAVRTVNHKVIDEHAFATNLVHTGRLTSGNVMYPSLGSVVSHERGPAGKDVPSYVLIGYPNPSRGPGFLGAKCGYVYLTDTSAGLAGFARQADVDAERAAAREKLLAGVGETPPAGSAVAEYASAQAEALRLAGPGFLKHFDLTTEPDDLRNSYGGEFGQRCLLSRRLVQAGVRFIEVSHNLNFLNGTGWDVHNEGIRDQHKLIQELDKALAALVLDLEQKKLLDKTLIVVASEFGRPAQFDAGGGRGHHGKSFSVALAGGGLKPGTAI